MIVNLKTFTAKYSNDPRIALGCIVDTNLLFGAAYPLDRLNTASEKFFEICREQAIPVYTNINVRAEFLELFRRGLLSECLLDFRTKYQKELTEDAAKRLKNLDQRFRENTQKNRTTLLGDQEIKEFRKTLLDLYPTKSSANRNLWMVLCEDFLRPQIEPVWDDATRTLGINFAGSRAVESSTHFSTSPTWEGATTIMGNSGMGSMDAMIVNFFTCSKFFALATADNQVAEFIEAVHGSNRLVIFPDEDELS